MNRYKCKFRMKGRGPENEKKKKQELLEAIPTLLPPLADIISDYTDPLEYFSDLPPHVKNLIYKYYDKSLSDQILRDLRVLKFYSEHYPLHPSTSTYSSDIPRLPDSDSDEEKEGGI